jgi:hypothetical protein
VVTVATVVVAAMPQAQARPVTVVLVVMPVTVTTV